MAMAGSKVALVSGANKGIGFHIARILCGSLPAGSVVYCCSRDEGALALAATARPLAHAPATPAPTVFVVALRPC